MSVFCCADDTKFYMWFKKHVKDPQKPAFEVLYDIKNLDILCLLLVIAHYTVLYVVV